MRVSDRLAGGLLALMMVLATFSALYPDFSGWPAGLCGWTAGILLWRRLPPRQSMQAVLFVAVGVLALLINPKVDFLAQVLNALSVNNGIISMLLGVSFLRLVSGLAFYNARRLPKGKKAFWATQLGIHLFGAVINLSAVLIVAERLQKNGRLQASQAIVLSRAFSAAALWSPFFAAMAAALTYVPGANMPTLVVLGAPLAAISLWVTAYQFRVNGGFESFIGYPMHFNALWLPALLAASVLLIHGLAPSLPVLGVVTLLAPSLTIIILWIATNGSKVIREMHEHIRYRLPEMANELVLFLAAGILAAGLASVLDGNHQWLPFHRWGIETFGVLEAAVTLALIILLAVIGIHPIIGISLFAVLLAPLKPAPDLLAMIFLVGWSLGVSVSPVSGLHLTLQARYGIDGWRFSLWNLSYAGIMYVLAILIIAFQKMM